MLISDRMNRAINEQIGNEFAASLQYVAIAAYFAGESLGELAAHFYRQAEEERTHALRFVHYLTDAGGSLVLPPLPAARGRFEGAEEAVCTALKGEQEVTRQINALVDLAIKDGDHITHNFLQWFVTEQLEEMTSMDTLLKVTRRAGENGLLHVEEYLARRAPAAAAEVSG